MTTWPWNSHPIRCRECGDPYTVHEAGGGPCRGRDGDGPCLCEGFRWVDLEGAEHQGYRATPRPAGP